MAENEEFTEDESSNEFVTKSELREMLQEILGGGTGKDESGDDDSDDGWEVVEEFDDAIESLTSLDVERIAEQKVQEAIKKLTGMKKTTAPAKKAAPKKVAPEPEVEPTVKKRSKWSSALWGSEE